MITKLIIPIQTVENNRWWEEYPQLNSSLFTYQNSGRHLGEPYPYSEKIDGGLKTIIGVSNRFNILGYTLNPPFETSYKSVAIMFERKDDFTKMWFHYVR